MTDSIEQSAQRIIASLKRSYGAPSTRRSARENDFGHLDMHAYRDFQTHHEAQGFRMLWDYEVAEVSDSPTTLIARTFIRSMVSRDGTIVADYYQVRPRIGRLMRSLFRGLLNGRWIDAPRFVLKKLKTRHCNGYESECSDGGFITTSNAQSAGMISSPPTVDSVFHPYGTPPMLLLADHKERLAAWVAAHPGNSVRVVTSVSDLQGMQNRLKEQKNAHRAAVSWVTESELVKMSDANPAVAQAVYNEVQRQLRGDPEPGATLFETSSK